MVKSTRQSANKFSACFSALSDAAHKQGLTDTAWAARAGIRKETLSRIRSRRTADFETLHALARTVNAELDVFHHSLPAATADGHFPQKINRDYEESLLILAISDSHEPQHWLKHGSAFFMAGLAVMVASLQGMNRYALLSLAEQLHPGSSLPDVFSIWLKRTPLQVSRFASMLNERMRHAA